MMLEVLNLGLVPIKSLGWSTNSIPYIIVDSIHGCYIMFIRLTLHGAVSTTTDGLSNPKNEDANIKLLVLKLKSGAN